MSVNKVILIGRLGRDPEMRYTNSGDPVCNFTLATSEKRGGTEKTEWHRIVVFGAIAENVHKYLEKGREVYVEGRIETNKYKDKAGIEKESVQIIAHAVQFLGAKGTPSQGQQRQQRTDDADIPF